MKVIAIIAEYNPLHNGHIYQLERAKDELNPDYSIAIMSGNFTQRGEMSILSKWERAQIAVRAGLDLVIELPAIFACNNSEYFAKGAIEILNRLGIVTHLVFGSESGDTEELLKLSGFLIENEALFFTKIKEFSKLGFSHFESRQKSVEAMLGESYAKLLLNSNNILALEYLRQLKLTQSSIIPYTIKRNESNFNEAFNSLANFASASAIRNFVKESGDLNKLKKFMPGYSLLALELLQKNTDFAMPDKLYFSALGAKLLDNSKDFSSFFAITEGLENRIISAFRKSKTIDELCQNASCKRYAKSRINRALSHVLLGITKDIVKGSIEKQEYYTRVLAFNSKKSSLLREIKKRKAEDFPLISNLNKELSSPALVSNRMLALDMNASDFYAMLHSKSIYENSDLVKSPIIL